MDDLLTRVQTEADQCRNDGADDIARLLDEVTAEVKVRRSRIDELVSELVDLVAENEALRSHAVPASMALVPVEPTIEMQVAGFESEAWDALSDAVLAKKGWPYSCRQSAECVSAIWRAMLAAAPGTPSSAPVDGAARYPHPDEDDAVTLWAEIHRLRAAVRGPDGYESWQDAATAERVRRVAGMKVMRQALEALQTCMAVPHWPSLCPTIEALRAALGEQP